MPETTTTTIIIHYNNDCPLFFNCPTFPALLQYKPSLPKVSLCISEAGFFRPVASLVAQPTALKY